MNRIDIGLPCHIGANKVKEIIENFLKNNTDFRCEVNYVNKVGDESRYMVEYSESLTLYYIGFAVCGIEKAYPIQPIRKEVTIEDLVRLQKVMDEQQHPIGTWHIITDSNQSDDSVAVSQ